MSNRRFLSSQEIEDIISFIKPQKGIPQKTARSIVEYHKNSLRNKLRIQYVNPRIIPELARNLERYFFKSLIAPGFSPGIVCAQSIGERQTQATLNTFHFTGSSEKINTTTVVRINELLNATSNQKNRNCLMIFKEKDDTLSNLRELINHTVVGLHLVDLITRYEIRETHLRGGEDWYSLFEEVFDQTIPDTSHHLVYHINLGLLLEYQITLEMIAQKLEEEYDDIFVVFSPDSVSQLHIFAKNPDSINLDNSLPFITEDNRLTVYYREVVHKYLENVQICGITGVKGMFVERNPLNLKHWAIETDGSNLKEIFGHPDIDFPNTLSNDIHEIYETLGIEATREFMIEEFMKIIGDINLCHVKMLVDKMTFTGTIQAITRFSSKKEDIGPLTSASFEEVMDRLAKAGIFSLSEDMKGVSSSIMSGKLSQAGTGSFGLLIDVDKL